MFTFSHFWNVARIFFSSSRRLNNRKQSLQYLMKCLCCGTWTYPHPQRPAGSQVGHYCSHLQRARASLRQRWCQSSGICCKTAGDVGAVPYPSTGRTENRCREKKKLNNNSLTMHPEQSYSHWALQRYSPQQGFCCLLRPEITAHCQRRHSGRISSGASLLSTAKTQLCAGTML